MNKLILALLLVGGGIALIVGGSRRSDSLAGIVDDVGSKLASKWDGKVRQPGHVWYYVGGGVLILAGALVALRKGA
ncbi:MAG TPA: hypothetical protein VHN79_00630 [Lacunisphaera sp.]|nr:hypothetical protein [Lacunisphaera sp.]